MIHVADGLRVPIRAKPLDLVEGEFGACADDKKVVINPLAVFQLDAVFGGVDALCRDRNEMDLRFAKVRVRSISTSSRVRQFTATQGFDGTK